MSNVGTLYIIAAPSGAGKTTLVKALLLSMPDLKVSISYTTRQKRVEEKHGRNYFFVDDNEFDVMVGDNVFLEHAVVFDHRYGTSRDWVLEQLKKGVDVVLEIDWQGARQIRSLFNDSLSVFILPPSVEVLWKRLEGRNQDTKEVVESRMQAASNEVSHFHEFDYIVINDEFDQALMDLQHIIKARRLRSEAQGQRHANMLAKLLESG